MVPIVGIHLGSTHAAIAMLDDNGHPAIVSVDGERIMASCVYEKTLELVNNVVSGTSVADYRIEK
jgi:hypothetical protein